MVTLRNVGLGPARARRLASHLELSAVESNLLEDQDWIDEDDSMARKAKTSAASPAATVAARKLTQAPATTTLKAYGSPFHSRAAPARNSW
jgi:hypothetical protein